MSRILPLLILFLTASTTLSFGQTDPALGTAFDYAVLSKEHIINNQNTSVYGIVGSANRTSVTDNGKLTVADNLYQMGTSAAKQALTDANAAFTSLYNLPGQALNFPTLGGRSLEEGVWRIQGNATLNGGLTLNANGNPNAVFVIIITGNLTSDVDKAWVNLINGAQPKNVFWVVNGQVNTGKTSLFQGTVITNGEGGITFGNGGIIIGRAIALKGNVTLNDNLVFMPNMIIANLSVMKVADAGEYTLGGTVTYTITATNLGPDNATGVRVIEEIPSGLRFISATPERGTYDPVTHIWTIGNLAVNTEVSLRITFEIISTGNIKNRVIIIGDNPDQSPDQDEDEEDIIVSELGVTKEIVNRKETYYVGDVVRYKITVRNNTSATETNVQIGEKLPEELAYIGQSIVAPPGVEASYTPATGILHIKSLPGNAIVELFIDAQLIKNGRVANIARIINKDVKPDKPANPDDDYKDSDPDNDEDEEVIPEVLCPPLTVSLTSSAAVHCASVQGLVLTATEVIGATYDWALPAGWVITSGDRTNRIVVTPNALGGSQEVKVTVKNQCNVVVESTPININITGTPVVPVINGGNTVCFNATEGTQLSTPEVEGYTYTWEVVSGGIKLSGEGASVRVLPVNADNLEGGIVKLTVTNNCGLSNTATKTITITPAPARPTAITGDINLCQSNKTTFTATEVTGATSYIWTFPSDWKVEGAANGSTVTVIIGNESGVVTVRAVNECSAGEAATKSVTVVQPPTVENFTLTSEKDALCEGETMVITATEVPGAKGYKFDVTPGLQIVKTEGNQVTVKAGAISGRVSVTVTDFCGEELTVSKNITVTPKLTKPEISGAAEICRSSTGNVYEASGYDVAVTYEWTVASGDLTITSGAATSRVEVSTGLLGGTLKLIVKNANGCFTESTTRVIKTIALPTLPTTITGPTDLCEGETITYSVPAIPGVNYTWSVPAGDGWAIIGENNKPEVSIKIGAKGGNITLNTTDACGVISNTVALPINVTNKPLAPAIASTATTGCVGATLTFSIESPVAGYTYTWAVPQGWSANTLTGTSITVTVGETSGDIEVYATNTVKNCGAGTTTKLAVAPSLKPVAPGTISSNMNVCINSKGNAFSITAVPGATSYEWEVNGGLMIEGAKNGTSITVAAAETGGTVRVRAINGCGMSDWTTLNVDLTMPPAPVTRITDNSSVCEGLIYTAEAVAGATSYNWTVSEGFTIESGQGTTTIKVKASSPNATGRVSVIAYNGSCVGSAEYSIDIDAERADGQLEFPKAFSPNGDGKNDEWLVKNLDKFPDNEIVIFNRWGSEVYKQKSYKNDWAAKGLEQGTYFYKVRVKLCDGVYKDYSGYMTIFR